MHSAHQKKTSPRGQGDARKAVKERDASPAQYLPPPPPPKKSNSKDPVVNKIQQMERERAERRELMEQKKIEKKEREELNKQLGKNVDVDFEQMIENQRFKEEFFQPHTPASDVKLCVCVRKRPIFKKEENAGEIDAISCANPSIRVLAPKHRVDGITKYVENFDFTYDNTFSEKEESEAVYEYSLRPTLEMIMNGGVVTCFAYGQTGSGKTFTMKGLQESLVNDMYRLLNGKYKDRGMQFFVSFFEIYGGRCYDLMNSKAQLVILEDKNNNVQVQGLVERSAGSAQEMNQLIEFGHSVRTTHSTIANDTSSRSHAICQIALKDAQGREVGKLALVDLAGSERAQDCQSNNRQRRMEGAEINKSLLALKECIRAMDMGAGHVPFRASKLTLVLRDSFMSRQRSTRVIMIACVSPGSSSSDHSINTLRYADRLKENKPVITKQQSAQEGAQSGAAAAPAYAPSGGSKPRLPTDSDEPPIAQRAAPPAQQAPPEPLRSRPPAPADRPDDKKEQYHQRESPSNQDYAKRDSPSAANNKKPPSFHKQPSPRQSRDSSASSGSAQSNQSASVSTAPGASSAPGSERALRPAGKPPQPQQQQQQQQAPFSSSSPSGNANPPGMLKKQSSNNIAQNNTSGSGEHNSDEEVLPPSPQIKGVKEDVRCMKETLKLENPNKISNEFFDFHEKVNTILEEQEEIFATHMAAIKEDAKLLTQESELISNVQGVGFMDYDIDLYVKKLETVIKKKLKMYNMLSRKLDTFKKHLQEEEEISSKVKDTFYF